MSQWNPQCQMSPIETYIITSLLPGKHCDMPLVQIIPHILYRRQMSPVELKLSCLLQRQVCHLSVVYIQKFPHILRRHRSCHTSLVETKCVHVSCRYIQCHVPYVFTEIVTWHQQTQELSRLHWRRKYQMYSAGPPDRCIAIRYQPRFPLLFSVLSQMFSSYLRFLDCLTLEDGKDGCPETNLR